MESAFRESDKKTPLSSPPLSKDEGLSDVGHSMIFENLILVASSVTVSYLIHFDSLLQNAIDIITKCNSYFIIECDRRLLQNASGILLQNVTFLLQNATIITNYDDFITNCDVCYKLRQYSHINMSLQH